MMNEENHRINRIFYCHRHAAHADYTKQTRRPFYHRSVIVYWI